MSERQSSCEMQEQCFLFSKRICQQAECVPAAFDAIMRTKARPKRQYSCASDTASFVKYGNTWSKLVLFGGGGSSAGLGTALLILAAAFLRTSCCDGSSKAAAAETCKTLRVCVGG